MGRPDVAVEPTSVVCARDIQENTFPLFSRTFRTRGRHGTLKQCRELSPILIARHRRPAVPKISRHLSTMQTARRKTVHSRVSDYYSLVYCLGARLGALFEAKNMTNSGNTVFLCRARKHRKWVQPRTGAVRLKVIYPGGKASRIGLHDTRCDPSSSGWSRETQSPLPIVRCSCNLRIAARQGTPHLSAGCPEAAYSTKTTGTG
jgi:hypothetical protein